MDNRSLGRVLHEIADALEIKGENAFRIRSYRMSAESVETWGGDVAEMVRRGESLRQIPGVGEGIAARIRELVERGTSAEHEELLAEVPRSLLELLKIPGLGPKGVGRLWRELGVRSAEDLEKAIADGRFRALPGMGEKKEERIRKGLAGLRRI
jgi:DNA polymerase (family 10)